MNSIGWNCRGLGNPQSVRALHDLVQCWDPKIVFLLETKVRKRRLERIKERIGFANGLFVPCQGRSSSLALLWLRETNLEIKSFGSHHIDVVVTNESSNFKWRLTGFYGHLQTHMRQQSWDLLAYLKNQF